jgi:hypothetical protein
MRCFQGEKPAPRVEGFSSVADASMRLCDIWSQDADAFVNDRQFKQAAEIYKRALCITLLPIARKAELHAFRAKTFRQLAESKKKVRNAAQEIEQGVQDDDPLHGLAAEWAIEEAETALELDSKCFLAAWEGAIAAKHIGWWTKGRMLAKKAMEAVPAGALHRSQRETASTLFLLMSEEEQAEKQRKVREMQAMQKVPDEPELDQE